MLSLRRRIANIAEVALNATIVPRGQLYAAFETEQLKKFFAHFGVDCVFDIGANRGQYARRLRNAVGFSGPIISYEPIPELAQIVRGIADAKWHVRSVALDRTPGRAAFNIMHGDEFSSLLQPSNNETDLCRDHNRIVKTIDVEVTTLAHEIATYADSLGFKRPFLKMDTQGNEVAVAEGAGDALQNFAGIQTEVSFRRIYQDSPDLANALHYYQSRGFEPTALFPNNAGHFPHLLEMDCLLHRADLS